MHGKGAEAGEHFFLEPVVLDMRQEVEEHVHRTGDVAGSHKPGGGSHMLWLDILDGPTAEKLEQTLVVPSNARGLKQLFVRRAQLLAATHLAQTKHAQADEEEPSRAAEHRGTP